MQAHHESRAEVAGFVNAGHFQVITDTIIGNPEIWECANAEISDLLPVTILEIRLGICESTS
jgi:hypothetical protein